jgi:phage shock protein E
MNKLINWINRNRFIVVGVMLGAIGGFLYWNFIGCSSGTCSIISKPLNSTLYGALLGGTLLSAIAPDQKENNKS